MKIAMTRVSLGTTPFPRIPFVVKHDSLSGGNMITAQLQIGIDCSCSHGSKAELTAPPDSAAEALVAM
jgi:hypothetical protein